MAPASDRPAILVVDDEPHILHVVKLKLAKAGFRVLTAADGEEGLDLARRERPALIITDYQMPYLDGPGMCEKLYADPTTADIPVVMLTARGFSLTEDDLAATHIVRLLSKPFSPREVLALVEELLEPRRPVNS